MFAPNVAKPRSKAAPVLPVSQRTQPKSAQPDGDVRHQEAVTALEGTTAGKSAPVASWDFGRTPVFSPHQAEGPHARPASHRSSLQGALQPKLVIGASADPMEREANRAADAAMGVTRSPWGDSRGPAAPGRKSALRILHAGADGVHLQAKSSGGLQARGIAPASVHSVLGQPGQALEPAARAFLEPSFGRSLGEVRIHDGRDASASAADVGAKAYTVGRNVVFGAGEYRPGTPEGRWLLAHEVTHVLQQGEGGLRLQRYEAGEHAQMGETKDSLKGVIEESFKKYTVVAADYLETIAASHGITVSELKDANRALLKTINVIKHPGPDKGAYMVVDAKTPNDAPEGKRVWLTNRTKIEVKSSGTEWHDIKVLSGKAQGTEGKIMSKYLNTESGFDIGAVIRIPTFATAAVKDAYKGMAPKIKPHGVELDYGSGVAMGGDLYESPEQMDKAPEAELKDIDALVKRDQTAAKVSDAEWQKATGGRYTALAEKNEGHFAPPNAAIATESTAGKTAANNKSEWEKHHRSALDTSKAGDKDKALTVNAFGDHFLTDAFSAGHLISKRDVMEQFKGQLKLEKSGKEFTKDSKKFFDGIAKEAFQGDVAKEFSKYETADTHFGVHVNIDSVNMLSRLLQAVHLEEPDLLASAVAKGVHDVLNTASGGIQVVSLKSGIWQLSGDKTLNEATKRIAQKAVAQSQLNVLSVHGITTAIDYAAMFKAVWDYVPQPTPEGLKTIVEAVKTGTDVNSADLKTAIVDLIKGNYMLIIAELVKRKKLRKA